MTAPVPPATQGMSEERLAQFREYVGNGGNLMNSVARMLLAEVDRVKALLSQPAAAKVRCLDPGVTGGCQRGKGHDGGCASYDIDDAMAEHDRRVTQPAVQATPGEAGLAELRAAGWSVAVHNDYRLNGAAMTFWLFTHADGSWVKGEGATDAEAINAALAASQGRPVPVAQPGEAVPAAAPRCDGSGRLNVRVGDGVSTHGTAWTTCPGCHACPPRGTR